LPLNAVVLFFKRVFEILLPILFPISSSLLLLLKVLDFCLTLLSLFLF